LNKRRALSMIFFFTSLRCCGGYGIDALQFEPSNRPQEIPRRGAAQYYLEHLLLRCSDPLRCRRRKDLGQL